MGRTKATPKKRQRTEEPSEVITDHEKHNIMKEQSKAIAALLSAPQEAVEEAAAKATANAIKLWPKLDDCIKNKTIDDKNNDAKDNETEKDTLSSSQSSLPGAFRGLGWFKIPPEDIKIYKKLHEIIKSKTSNNQTSWSGSITDPRRRSFGFIPNTLGHNENIRNKYLDISKPFLKDDDDTDKDVNDERNRNKRATIILSNNDIPSEIYNVLDRTITQFKKQIEKQIPESKHKQNLLKYLKKETLISLQPNLHNGLKLLPSHIDHPTKDGFGIIIITIGIKGDANIMLQDYGNKTKGAFTLYENECYMLCDRVRNECSHGVLAFDGSEDRESLNLRFGLHDLSPDGVCNDDGIIRSNDVLKHWN